jgi:hypothetical protein
MNGLEDDHADRSVARRALRRAMSTAASDGLANSSPTPGSCPPFEQAAQPETAHAPGHDAMGAPAAPSTAAWEPQNVPVSDFDAAAAVPPAARAAREPANQASVSSQSEAAVAGKRLSLKVSLRSGRRLKAPSRSVQVPEWARQRSIGSIAKPIMLAAGLVMLTLVLAGGYWMLSREGTVADSPTGLRSDEAMIERMTTPPGTGQAGRDVPAATGEASQSRPFGSAPVEVPAASPPTVRPAPSRDMVGVAPTSPASAPAPAPAPAPVASAAPAPQETVGAGGKPSAQLATVFSRKTVTYEWHRLQTLLPDLLGSRGLLVSKRHEGGPTRWLLRTSNSKCGVRSCFFRDGAP